MGKIQQISCFLGETHRKSLGIACVYMFLLGDFKRSDER
jgi:hypothetical protein